MQWLHCSVAGVVWCGLCGLRDKPFSATGTGEDDGGPPGHPHSLPEGGGQAGGQTGEKSPGQTESQQQEQQQREEQHHQGADTSLYISLNYLLSDLLVFNCQNFK